MDVKINEKNFYKIIAILITIEVLILINLNKSISIQSQTRKFYFIIQEYKSIQQFCKK